MSDTFRYDPEVKLPPIDWSDPKLTGAAQITMPFGTITAIDTRSITSLVLHAGGKEVLRITPDGELIFANASEAAEALLREWSKVTGRECSCTPAEGRFVSTCRTHGESGSRSAES